MGAVSTCVWAGRRRCSRGGVYTAMRFRINEPDRTALSRSRGNDFRVRFQIGGSTRGAPHKALHQATATCAEYSYQCVAAASGACPSTSASKKREFFNHAATDPRPRLVTPLLHFQTSYTPLPFVHRIFAAALGAFCIAGFCAPAYLVTRGGTVAGDRQRESIDDIKKISPLVVSKQDAASRKQQ